MNKLPNYNKIFLDWFNSSFEGNETWKWIEEKQRLRIFDEDGNKVHSIRYSELLGMIDGLPKDPRLVFSLGNETHLFTAFPTQASAPGYWTLLIEATDEYEVQAIVKADLRAKGRPYPEYGITVVQHEHKIGIYSRHDMAYNTTSGPFFGYKQIKTIKKVTQFPN